MGGLFSRWRHQPSTVEVLEKIDKDIVRLEKENRGNLEKQKRMIGSLVLYSVFFYVISAIAFYFYYQPEAWRDRLIYCTPLFIFPVLVWMVKWLLHWYFVKRITKNESALEDLKDKKQTILENVKETETYKKAKEILEKFAPEKSRHLESPTAAGMSPPRQGQELRQRVIPPQQGVTPQPRMQSPAPLVAPMTTPRQMAPPDGFMATPRPPAFVQQGVNQRPAPGPPLPCAILPRDRSTMEMLVEYLVGDGPQNRYALVCRQCHSHNGMALKEEFEYITFRCCYCYTMNAARKQRPHAPQLKLRSDMRTPVHNQDTGSREVASTSTDPDAADDTPSTEEPQPTDTNIPAIVRRKKSGHAVDDDVTKTRHSRPEVADEGMQSVSAKKKD